MGRYRAAKDMRQQRKPYTGAMSCLSLKLEKKRKRALQMGNMQAIKRFKASGI